MFEKCACQYCKGHIEFDGAYAGFRIVCPHCGSETKLLIPETPLPELETKQVTSNPDASVGRDVLPGPWMDELMSEKQKAMFVLYGLSFTERMTKGEAAKIIDVTKKSGAKPTEENSKRAEKLFLSIEQKESKKRLKELGEEVFDAIKIIQAKDTTIKQLEILRSKLEDIFKEIFDKLQGRIDEIDQEECDRENEKFKDY
jgi:hypothetical protein